MNPFFLVCFNWLFCVCVQCGRAFDPHFLFLWPNARVSMVAPGYAAALTPPEGEEGEEALRKINKRWDTPISLLLMHTHTHTHKHTHAHTHTHTWAGIITVGTC